MRLNFRLATLVLLAVTPFAARAQQPTPLALQPAGSPTQALPLDRVIAVVGDVIVTQSNLQERVIQKRQEGVRMPDDSAGFRTFLIAVVNELVDEELILQKAKDLKVEVPEADVNSTVDKQFKDVRKRFGSESEFKTELSKAGYGTPEEYRRFLTDGTKRNETITRTIRKLREDGKIVQHNVTDADVAESFERNKGTLPKREPSITWRQIIVSPRPSPTAREVARTRAESLLVEIKTGGDFEKLAKRESGDPSSAENGGDLGWNRRGKMVKEFDRWMFSLTPGQLSPVVETVFGYHIIRVDRVNPSEVKARHILIIPKIDSVDVARARAEASAVLAALKAGAAFDSLAKAHHDFASGEETIPPSNFPKAQLPPAYQTAFTDKVAKDIVTFEIAGNGNVPAKFVVASITGVEEGGDLTLEEVKERFRTRLADEGGVKRLMESLRKATYVLVKEDALTMPAPAATPPAP